MQTRVEKTAPLFADEFEKKELQQRPEYFAGKSQVDEAELNKWKDEKKVMLLKMDEYQKDVQMSLPFDSILIEVPH